MKTINSMEIFQREGAIEPTGIKSGERTVTVSFASEEPYKRWFGTEVLQVDETALELTRFSNGIGCVLYNHNRDDVVGRIDRAWIEQGKAYAEITFDDDEEAEKIYHKVKSGTLKGVSVGYIVNEYTEVKENESLVTPHGEIKGPCYVATKWEAMEISIVSVPADASVGVGRSQEEAFKSIVKALKQKEEEQSMSEEQKNMNQINVEQSKDNHKELREAIQKERERCENITTLCRHFNIDAKEWIEKGTSLADVQTQVLAKAAQNTAPAANFEVKEEEADKYRAAATDALLMRAGVCIEQPAAGANELRSMRLRSLMCDVLEREGVAHVQRMDDDELVRAALTGTGALPGILSNVANKTMGKAYAEAPTTFQYFTSVGSNVDFKEASQYRLSEAGELVEVTENGEFEQDELKEGSAKKKVLTFGRAFTFTRQMIINDDLGALTRIPALYSAAAKRGINRLVYQQLTAANNYSEENGNMASTGGALSLSTINAGRVAMRKQKNMRDEAMLNIVPKFLIVPAELEFTARQMLTSTSDPDGKNSGVVNPLMNSMQVVSDAELDDIDNKAWYMAADPMLMDTIEVTYLNGQQTPTIESQIAFDTLGIRYRIYMDYGVTVLDAKGLYKNAGAGK
ncbi:prohead protease/major capsid protein fusion protein [uncultured Megasphaera sp.]|uniref:prohead protease/major capsid protein fusion protein n=1 Tax=uncultured Megasphaera sp. TaxID=165188 RepID=UPI00266DD532|nr:prohead protease/major capsid protein fusion protein [uncultured Megasphaera sp.]